MDMAVGSAGNGGATTAATANAEAARARNPWLTLVALALGAATAIVAQTLVLPVLPAIAGEFGVSQTDAIWVLTVNLLAATVFSPLIGRLGDAWGRKRIMVVAMVAVLAGSVIAAVASAFWLVLVGRVLQGTAFGVIALAISIVRDTFPTHRVSLGIALLSAIMGIGGGAGLVLSGLLAEVGDFELIFWASAGAAALGLALIVATVPESSGGGDRALDVPGTILLAGWLACLLLAIDRGSEWGWDDGKIIGLFAGAAVLLAVWIPVEFRARVPLVDMSVFAKPVVLGTNITGLLIGLGMFGAFTLINQFVQTPEEVGYGFSADALESGLTLLPMTLGTLIAAPLTSLLITKLGPKFPLATGALITAAGFSALAVWNAEQWYFLVTLAFIGVGVGLSMASMPQMLNPGVPHSQTGIANGMNATLRELGSSTGSAMAAAILSSQLIAGTEIPSLDAYETAFVVSAGLALVAAAAAALIPLPKARAQVAAQVAEPAPETTTLADGHEASIGANGNGVHRDEGEAALVGAGPRGTGELTSEVVNGSSAATAASPTVLARHAAGSASIGAPDRGVYGRVIRPGGAGLVGATVTVTDLSGHQVGRGFSGDDGSYRVPAPAAGHYVMIVSAPGHQPDAHRVLVGETSTEFDVTLTGSASLSGTVRGAGGRALPGARVVLTDAAGDITHTAITGDEGDYAFTALLAGSYTLVVSETAHQPSARTVDMPDTGQVHCDVALPQASALIGTVRSVNNGNGVGDARVSLLDQAGNQIAVVDTDSHGAYRLTDLTQGHYTVIATGYAPVANNVHVNGDGPTELDLELGHPEP